MEFTQDFLEIKLQNEIFFVKFEMWNKKIDKK